MAAETQHSYGRRMAKPLQDEGFHVGRAKARRLMNKVGVAVHRLRRRGPMTTNSRHHDAVAPNLLARQFDVTVPNHVWAGAITYRWTAEGWRYLAVLGDLYARKVVGWAMNHHMETTLVQDALQMALGRRSPSAGLRHHSDRGSQYDSHAYQAMVANRGIVCSMREKGECLDNAVAERCFGSLKGERTSRRHYATRQEAWDDVIDDIEMFYNSKWLHAYLGYVSPNDSRGGIG
jgi:putative transposase